MAWKEAVMSVSLPPDIEAFVEREIACGNYSSREELIVRAVGLLRDHDAELAKLRAEIEKGWDGPGIPLETAFSRLRASLKLPSGTDAT
jgi:putative addiction module CopG family antidote